MTFSEIRLSTLAHRRSRLRFRSFLALVLTSLSALEARAQDSLAEVVGSVSPSVVTIRTFDVDGRAVSAGSGFHMTDGRVATNAHVVRGAANVEIFDSSGRLIGTAGYAEAVSNSVDVAILPRVDTAAVGLEIAVDEPSIGTRVIVFGSPQGLENTVSDGIVSAVRDIEGRRMIQVTAPISPGSSGGPVVDLSGRVIGIAAASLSDGQNLNFAVPARALRVVASSPTGRVAFGAARASDIASVSRLAPISRYGETLAMEREVISTLHTGLDQLDDGSYYEFWNFEATAGVRYRITMRSGAFDTYLSVYRSLDGGGFVEVRSNDDINGFTTDSRVNFTANSSGPHVIYATSYEPYDTGEYTIELEER